MPEHAPPRTHQARLVFLQNASQRDRYDSLLSQRLSSALNTLFEGFNTLFFRELDLTADRKSYLDRRKTALTGLNMLIRHYWQGLRLQVRRGELPKTAFLEIGLNSEGHNLRLVRISEKLHAAKMLVAGAAAMKKRGWQLHEQPAACEVEAALTRITHLNTALHRLERDLAALKQSLTEKAARIDILYGQLYHEIGYALYGRSAAEKRRARRNYGFVFRYRPDRDGSQKEHETNEIQETGETESRPQPASASSLSDEERRKIHQSQRLAQRRFQRRDRYRRGKRRKQQKSPAPTIAEVATPEPERPHHVARIADGAGVAHDSNHGSRDKRPTSAAGAIPVL